MAVQESMRSESGDVFTAIAAMRARGWVIAFNFVHQESLGCGLVSVSVDFEGRRVSAIAETLDLALRRAVKRWERGA